MLEKAQDFLATAQFGEFSQDQVNRLAAIPGMEILRFNRLTLGRITAVSTLLGIKLPRFGDSTSRRLAKTGIADRLANCGVRIFDDAVVR